MHMTGRRWAWITLALALIFGGPARAANINLSDILTKQGCPAKYTTDAGTLPTCNYEAYRLCQNPMVQGCDSYFPANAKPPVNGQAPQLEWGSGLDKTQFTQKQQQFEKQLKKDYDTAYLCCGSGCKDQLWGEAKKAADDNASAVRNYNGATAARGGLSGQQTATSTVHENGMRENSGLAALCRSSAVICNAKYDQVAKGLSPSVCKDCTGDEVTTAQKTFNDKAEECEKLKSDLWDKQAQSYLEGRTQADQGRGKTQDRLNGGGAGGGSGAGGDGKNAGNADGKGDGKGNDRIADGSRATKDQGMNMQSLAPMMMAAAPLLSKLFEKDQNANQDQQTQQQFADCSTVDANGMKPVVGCTTANTAVASLNKENGTAGMQPSSTSSGGGFNLPNNGDSLNPGGAPNPAAGTGAPGSPVTTHGVQQGGGGFGGGGGGGAAAGGGVGGSGGGGGAGGGSKVPELRESGGPGGGVGSQLSRMNTDTNGGGGGYSLPANGMNNGMSQIDLAEFLPGSTKYGDMAAARGLAGLNSAAPMGIQSKSVNIWNRISEQFRSRCAQGLLRDCGP